MLDCICDASYLSRFNRITVKQFWYLFALTLAAIFSKNFVSIYLWYNILSLTIVV